MKGKGFKRCLSILLAIAMVIGLIGPVQLVKAASETSMTLAEASYDDSNTRYVLWLQPSDGRAVVDMGTTSATVVIDGTTYTSASWVAKGSKSYALALPYSIVQGSGITSNSSVKTHYVTLKAGSTVGDVILSEDLYFKIVGGAMTGGTCYIEQIDSLPSEMFLRNPDKDTSNYLWYFIFPDFRSVTQITYWGVTTTVYVDGVATSCQWYSGGSYYGLRIPFSSLGGSSISDVGQHHIMLPKGTTVGSMNLTRDYHYMTSGTVVKEVIPAEVSLGSTATYNDTNQQYVIELVPADGRTIFAPALSSKNILLNDEEYTEGIASWEQTSSGYSLKINYSTLDSEATTAASIGKYKITLPAGTFVGDMMLEEDYCIEIDGTSVQEYVGVTQTPITLTMTSGAYVDGKSVFWLKPTDGRAIIELGNNSAATVLVNGAEKTASWTAYDVEKGYQLTVSYSDDYTRYFTLKAGSTVGDVILSDDVYIKAIGTKMTGTTCYMEQVDELPTTPFITSTGYGNGSGSGASIYYYFIYADGRDVTSIGYWSEKTTVYVDGEAVTGTWYSSGNYYGVTIPYTSFGASTYNIGEHYVQFAKEGETVTVGSMTLTDEHCYMTQNLNAKQVSETPVFLGEDSGYDDENGQYVIELKPDDERTIIEPGFSSSNILVDNVEVADGIVAWEKTADGYALKINYATLESEATAASSIGKHKVTIPAGTYVGDMRVKEDYHIEVNATSVLEYVDVTPTAISFVDGGYQDSPKSRYVVNVKPTEDVDLETINTISGTILVNGVETTVGWEGYDSPSYYSITIPYSAIDASSTHADTRSSWYITVPAGTKIGNIRVSEALHVKIYGGTMTSNDYLLEQVTEVPEYFFKSWNYDTTKIVFYFKNTLGKSSSGWVANKQTIYIDGEALTVQWEGNGDYYYIPLTHTQLGGTALSNLPTRIIHIPKDTTIGEMTLTEDVWIKNNSTVHEKLAPVSVSVGAESSYHDGNGQYVIRLTPNDEKAIITPGACSTSVLIDGVKVEDAISYWDQGSDNYGACIKYSAIESGAEKASDVGVHTITFPAGTYFGNRILTEDFSVCINGEANISTSSKFTLTSSGHQDGQPNGNYRYVFWLKPTDGREIVNLSSNAATILVDGREVSSGVNWVDTSATDGYALAVNYSAIDSSASVSTDVGEHVLTIPAGTIVGDVAFAEDFMIKVNGQDISIYKPPVTVSLDVANSSYQNSPNYRYIFYISADDGREIVDLGSPSTTILVDGEEVSSGVSWIKGSTRYGLCVKYSSIVSDATSYDQIGEHVITLPAGSKVGDIVLAEDLHIKVNNGTISEVSIATLQHTETVCGQDGYQMKFIVKGASSAITKILNAKVSIDGNVTSEVSCNFGETAEDGYYVQLVIPYNAVQNGANTAAEVTGTHTIQIHKGAFFDDLMLQEDVYVLVTGENVTQIRKPDLTVAVSGHTDNASSGTSGLYFTVTPEDMLPYNSDGTISYTFIKDGISVDGAVKSDAEVKKLESGLYYIDLSAYDISHDTVVGISGIIQTDDYAVEYAETYFQYKTTTGWNIYIPPTNTVVTLSNDTINGEQNLKGIYMNATTDPLSSGVYGVDKFCWDSAGDDDDESEQHGGIYLNGSICSTATLQKKWDGYYYIDLSNVTELKAGDIITLDGTVFVNNYYVTYNPISYIYNKDGSFSLYDANAEAIPEKTVTLNTLYVNLDKQSTYTIPSAPIVEGNNVIIYVNGNETSDYTLSKEGKYIVKRVMENTILADTVSTVGDITYEQTIYLYKTGDGNLDAVTSAADIIRMKKNASKTDNLVGGASDLNFDGEINDSDYKLLVDLLLGKTTAEEIINADQSVLIGAISDTHYLANGRDGQSRINTRKALIYYKSQNVDMLILNGDITDLGEVGAYEELVADIKSVYPDEATRPEIIFTGDNHEWYDAWDGINGHVKVCEFEDTQDRFVEELSELRDNSTDTNTHYKVNGYHFIGVSSDGMNGGYATYKDTTIAWIEDALEAAAQDDATGKKPIFLAIHQAPKNTVIGSDGGDHFDSDELEAILKQYPQLVVITSHTHAPLQDERSIHQGNYTTLNTASTYYAGGITLENVAGGLMSEKYQFGQGLLIRTNRNVVDIERCDFYNDEKIKENWVFETSNDASDYTKYTDARANAYEAPEFAKDASIDAKWNSDGTATLTFDAATHADFVHHYILKVYKEGSATPSEYTYSNFFFLGLNRMDETIEFTLSNLSDTKDYTFEIQAVDSWGHTSAAISGTLEVVTDDE